MTVKTIRAFIALDLDKKAHAELTTLVESYKLDLVKKLNHFILPENYHLTLVFLGQLHLDSLPSLLKILQAVASQTHHFKIQMSGIHYFPNIQNPKVLAAIVNPSLELMILQQNIVAALKKLSMPLSLPDHFLPHISIANCKHISHPMALPRMPIDISSTIQAITLYQNHTQQEKGRYEKISVINFI